MKSTKKSKDGGDTEDSKSSDTVQTAPSLDSAPGVKGSGDRLSEDGGEEERRGNGVAMHPLSGRHVDGVEDDGECIWGLV